MVQLAAHEALEEGVVAGVNYGKKEKTLTERGEERERERERSSQWLLCHQRGAGLVEMVVRVLVVEGHSREKKREDKVSEKKKLGGDGIFVDFGPNFSL